MTITTEEAELLAQTHDLVRFTLSMKAPEHDLTAAALRSLVAERDALRANLDAIVIPTTYYMDPPDGGDVSIAEQVSRMYRHVCDLQAENARLREALEKLARLGAEPYYGNSDGNMIARAALGEKE
jgi:hypothetical protein